MKKRVFFAHIPKTAGTSIYEAACLKWKGEDMLYGVESQKIKEMATDELTSYQYIHCHVALPLGDRLGSDYFRFMFFREPLSRIISYYNFWRAAYQANPDLWRLNDGPDRAGKHTFGEFIRDPINEIEIVNAQTRYLCGDSLSYPESDFSTEEICGRLQELDFIGLTESFHQSVNGINSQLGGNIFSPESRSNVTNIKAEGLVSLKSMNEADLSYLKEMLHQDFITYECAVNLFNKRCGEAGIYS